MRYSTPQMPGCIWRGWLVGRIPPAISGLTAPGMSRVWNEGSIPFPAVTWQSGVQSGGEGLRESTELLFFPMDAEKLFFSSSFLLEFIEKYRGLPCLWKMRSKDYGNNARRLEGWHELTAFVRSRINRDADVTWVKKKVHTMRGSFRKEMKKVAASAREGLAYKPKLWYYKYLLFTKDEERASSWRTATGDEGAMEEDSSSVPVEEDSGHQPTTNTTTTAAATEKTKTPTKKRKQDDRPGDSRVPSPIVVMGFPSQEQERRPPRPMAHHHASQGSVAAKKFPAWESSPRRAAVGSTALTGGEDEYDFHGRTIAAKLRKIAAADYDQFLLADQLVNRVLFAALKQRLTEDTTICETGDEGASLLRPPPPPFPAPTYHHQVLDFQVPTPPPCRGWQSQNCAVDYSTGSDTSISSAPSPAAPTATAPDPNPVIITELKRELEE